MRLTEKSARATILGIISWLSVCLLMVGLFPHVVASIQWVWSMAGLFGLASAVGLAEALKVETRDQQKLISSFEKEARTDALTGLGNRRALDEELEYWEAHWQAGRDFSVLLIDADHFKEFNDTHGHAAGDAVLCSLADVLRQHVSGIGTATRFGGEEFALLLPLSDLESAQSIAEDVRRLAGGITVTVDTGQVGVTVSIGVAEAQTGDDIKRLLIRADEQLYAAKQAGRNCVRPPCGPDVRIDTPQLEAETVCS